MKAPVAIPAQPGLQSFHGKAPDPALAEADAPDARRRGHDGASALYRGQVMHQRLRPLRHRLAYRVYSLLLDLDELPALDARLRWFSVGRFNLFSFRPSDHGDGTASDAAGLRAHIEAQLRQAGLPTGGAVRLLALPRLLGYAFNPLSVWFCDAPDGALQAIVYEVNNTFGERHSYLIEVDADQRRAHRVEQRSSKRLFVSPFLGMALHYRFRIEPPRERLSVGVSVHDDADGAAVLNARLDAARTPLTDAALLRAFFGYPLLTLKVIAAIHWEALRLWLKGARLHQRPPAPEQPVTVVRPGQP
jgi:uncharacterized protein